MRTDPLQKIKALSERAAANALSSYPKRVKRTEDPGNLSVNMNNALTNAAHRLTLTEKRIMMFAVAKIDSHKAIDLRMDLKVLITASEFSKVYRVAMNTAYSELDVAVRKLYERTIGFSVARKKGYEGKDERWITGKHYHSGEGWVEIHVNKRILPLLTLLRGQFVSYKLKQASALRSVYAWRLLELLSQFKKTGWRQDDIADFATMMGAKETYANNFAQLRRWVIEPAVKELTEKDGWEISWEPLKAGRKVVALRFEFRHSPQQKLPLGVTA